MLTTATTQAIHGTIHDQNDVKERSIANGAEMRVLPRNLNFIITPWRARENDCWEIPRQTREQTRF